jgi:hypothetical protein
VEDTVVESEVLNKLMIWNDSRQNSTLVFVRTQ